MGKGKGKSKVSAFFNRGIKILIIALAITAILRCFIVESYRVPTSEMENFIKCGDFIFVDKTAYGIHLPYSIPTIPFLPDSVTFSGKTYPPFFRLPVYQFRIHPVNRNDIVVYNVPEISNHPINRLPTSISRCIGLPGDTLEVFGTEYYINGKKLSNSPDLILPYIYDEKYKAEIEKTMKKLDIPNRQSKKNTSIKHLSRYESYLIKCELSDFNVFQLYEKNDLSYKLIIPAKNTIIKLTPESLSKYRQIILKEMEENTYIKDNKLFIKGKEAEYYLFKENYYWLLSDNPNASSDSRHFGFISHSHLIGKARLIWLSKDTKQNIFAGYRWNRILTKVQ